MLLNFLITLIVQGNMINIDKYDVALAKLITCESHGVATAFRHNDGHSGQDSFGILQFQMPTITEYAKRYGIKIDDPINPLTQVAVAKEMLKEGRFNNWARCSRKNKIKELLK